MERITSLHNPRVKGLVRLRERRERERTGRFLVEGYRELGRALQAGIPLETVYRCPTLFLGHNEASLVEAAAAAGAEVVDLGEEAFRKVSYRERPEGLLGVARQVPTGLEQLPVGADTLLLVLESIEKPGNLGTMLRTADAAGADGVMVCDPATDPFNPNVVRASIGCLFTVPLAVAETNEAIVWCHRSGVRIVATTPDASLRLWDADLTGSVALVVGSEQYGLSEAWLDAADTLARIPMAGSADSLNAAMAAGIALFEAVRQRAG